MYVAVTGASGFIGSHVVSELRRRGHTVRAVVRNVDKTASALEMHALAGDLGIDIATADLTDHGALKRALDGVDAVVHTAAMFSLNPNDAERMAELNPSSVSSIISIASELGLSKVVYVSTMGVFVPAPEPVVSASSDLAEGCGPYTASKIAAEKIARAAVADGAPVISVYPGAVLGPIDPNPELSDSQVFLRDALKGKIPVALAGANLPIVDVRDVATVCVGAIEGGEHSRYLVPGETVMLTDIYQALSEMTGTNLKLRSAPEFVFTLAGKAADLASKLTKKKMLVTDESVQMLIHGAASKDVVYDWDPAKADFGVPGRGWRETVRDAAVWLHSAGHLEDKHVGELAE